MGYSAADHTMPYAKYYRESIAPIPEHVAAALRKGTLAAGMLAPLHRSPDLLLEGYAETETGYALEPDGGVSVSVLTQMPGVEPFMWDWWFGWHGSHANRYKLWHPKAHRDAVWEDGREDLVAYVGRVSLIEEYIGKKMAKAQIRFVAPEELGFDPLQLSDPKKTVIICARLGYSHLPVDIGWLVHQVRAVEGGSEMRSRFWMGGHHLQLRTHGRLSNLISKLLQKNVRLREHQATDLLVHCAEEMNHLSAILPELYTEFHHQ
ncbi:MAG: hypothetical protein HUU01_20790 [Saprospiraceae bacterium]|nr:hypothetical protein [Saprospiraceae bacterium]